MLLNILETVLKQNFADKRDVVQLDLSYWSLSDVFSLDFPRPIFIFDLSKKQNPPKCEIE